MMSTHRRQTTAKPCVLRYNGSLRSTVRVIMIALNIVSVSATSRFGEAAFVGSSLRPYSVQSIVVKDDSLVCRPSLVQRQGGSAILQMGLLDIFDGAKKYYGRKDNIDGKETELTKEEEYKKRLQEAARDPVTFEKFVLSGGLEFSTTTDTDTNNDSSSTKDSNTNGTDKKGYQRAEDWEAEQNANAEGGNMTWEEKVQFEGQRNGNRLRQNEILRQSIKLWK